MKNILLILSICFIQLFYAQDLSDAFRYGNTEILGTARYRGMAGAFGALGGDLSAIHNNPAGAAVFTNSFGSFTLGSVNKQNDILYSNDLTVNEAVDWNLNQFGAVLVYRRDGERKGLNKIATALSYHQTADNRNNYNILGRSNTSINQYFLNEAEGITLSQLDLQNGQSFDRAYAEAGERQGFGFQQALLGYEALLIDAVDPDDPNNTSYVSNTGSGNFDQDYLFNSSGINGIMSFNISGEFYNSLYLGVNLNSHFIEYNRSTSFLETNTNPGVPIRDIDFRNNISTTGSGVSAQIGGIYKSGNIRLGLSFDTPTILFIQEELVQSIDAFSDDVGDIRVAPDVINTFPEYQITTPGKITGSLAFLFGQSGLISLDYSYRDFSTLEFSSDEGVDFSDLNTQIEREFKEVSTFKIGGEYRLGNWSYRAGYSFSESPYQDAVIIGNTTGLAMGLGYSYGKWRFDMAYDTFFQDRREQFFPNSGFNNSAIIENYNTSWIFTLGLHL
ncbi:outer membrane protein transport protein [Aquimarina sp. ERC-38]|uniref:transporter n=1 Tax=Aquimarina sp. ERC-38 TaxID=2949996 RepID=UPI002245AE2D|nr:transporter [Aquimarina sp. ERC-38]UZO80590.1 outer membrane protein transport protein [Aquimarina sp. ERC-38]